MFAAAIVLVFLVIIAQAAPASPASEVPASEVPTPRVEAGSAGPAQTAGTALPGLESSFGGRLAETLGLLAGGGTVRLWLLTLLYGAVYGTLQAVFVGHRKLLLLSYFLAEDARPMQGMLAGTAVAFLQVGIAVGVVFLARFVLDTDAATMAADTVAWLRPATGALMAVLAAVLLVLRGIEYLRTREDWHEEKHISKLRPLDKRIDPNNEDPAVQLAVAHARKLRRRRHAEAPWLPVVIIAALAPSPSAVAATSYALGIGSPAVALVASAAVFVGLAVTLIALSVVTIVVKERLIDALGSRAAHFTHFGIEVAGAAAMLVLGGLLVTGIL
ncbi:MAG: hypothetical protein GVY23_04180 [Spirochaetes bacterium]|jgi:ABC-type nickel/cobalt efflux system permease component RcnA|nr:hypothetical protein [Spirochaetota bacterium]